MAKQKTSKAQRQGLALACYIAFHNISSIGLGIRRDRGFMEALTDDEVKELEYLKRMTKALSKKWLGFAWKLEGWDKNAGPPRRGKK